MFVLARNIIKLLVEKRRSLPFAHFRAKLVAVLLGMTLIPAVLVLLVGSELIRNSVDRWFNAPMDDVLSSANTIAGDYYQERQRLVAAEAQRLARAVGDIDLCLDTGRVCARDRRAGRAAGAHWPSWRCIGSSRRARAEPVLVPVVDVGPATLPRDVHARVRPSARANARSAARHRRRSSSGCPTAAT